MATPSNYHMLGESKLSMQGSSPYIIFGVMFSFCLKSVLDDIDKYCRKFLWGSSEGNRKITLVAWDKFVCQKRMGG